ncbi:MAG: zf-HC2 domain-containing protein [Chloroflexi bacterium]|nr:zf-HC2 domain-containing protein [Chloroflexota bacterium]
MGLLGRLTALLRREPECRDIRMAASDYIDGDLAETQVERVRTHLGGCKACQAFVDTLIETVRLLGKMKREEPAPAQLKDYIRARIAEEGRLHAR